MSQTRKQNEFDTLTDAVNKNTKAMELNDTQKNYLAEYTCSEKEEDFAAIGHAIDHMLYEVYTTPITKKVVNGCDLLAREDVPPQFDHHTKDAEEIKQLIGEDNWLDGCERATFHRTAVRRSADKYTEVRFVYTDFFRDNGADPNAVVFYDKYHGQVHIDYSEGWLREQRKKRK